MGASVMRTRLRIGPEARILREDETGIEVESEARLAPGRIVLVLRSGRDEGRVAFVLAWRLVDMGSAGPVYRGCCRWEEFAGTTYPSTHCGLAT